MQDGKHVILCIDDDQDILASLRVILESRGYRVVTAATAAEGSTACAAARPDLIIVDLMMEEIDSGMTFVERLRQSGNAAPVYVLSSTGDYLFGATDTGALGVSGVFQKPVNPVVLLSVLERKLGKPAA
jgi:CheY-like chemotaxis protein